LCNVKCRQLPPRNGESLTKPEQRGTRIDIEIPPALEKKLRDRAYEVSGGKKGGLRKVIIEALEDYLAD
jgi:hypothetical protein